MDSLTQFALGAACGEVVCGKKIGNKAHWWGGIAGTIPDLDIFANFFLGDVEAMVFHRTVSHSFTFSIIAPFVLAFLVHLYHKKDIHNRFYLPQIVLVFKIIFITLVLGVVNFIIIWLAGWWGYLTSFISLVLFYFLFFKNKVDKEGGYENPTYFQWYLLFAICFATHILLDACTPYGTELFWPFAQIRYAFNNISVVDFLYTLPLIMGLLISSIYSRSNKRRARWNGLGLLFSSLYILLTFTNHQHAKNEWVNKLDKSEIEDVEVQVNPTILNNILWHGVAISDSMVYESYYSLFDEISPFDEMMIYNRNLGLLEDCEDAHEVRLLKYFSKGFYMTNINPETGALEFIDMRYGSFLAEGENEEPNFVFKFEGDPVTCTFHSSRGGDAFDPKESLSILWNRIRGLKTDRK